MFVSIIAILAILQLDRQKADDRSHAIPQHEHVYVRLARLAQ
jgi:hypothetical protein